MLALLRLTGEITVVMAGVEGKSMLGEAAGKLGFMGRGVGAQGQGAGAADGEKKGEEEEVPAVTELKNRAGESRSPYVSLLLLDRRC